MENFKYQIETISVSRFGGFLTRWEKSCFGWSPRLSGTLTKTSHNFNGDVKRKIYKTYDFVRPSNFTNNILFKLVELIYNILYFIRDILFEIAPIAIIISFLLSFLFNETQIILTILIIYCCNVGVGVILALLGLLLGTIFGIFKRNEEKINFLKSGDGNTCITTREIKHSIFKILTKFELQARGFKPYQTITAYYSNQTNNFKQVKKSIKNEVDDFIDGRSSNINPNNFVKPMIEEQVGSNNYQVLYRLAPYSNNLLFIIFSGLLSVIAPIRKILFYFVVAVVVVLLLSVLFKIDANVFSEFSNLIITYCVLLASSILIGCLLILIRKIFKIDEKAILNQPDMKNKEIGYSDDVSGKTLTKQQETVAKINALDIIVCIFGPVGIIYGVLLIIKGLILRTFPRRAIFLIIGSAIMFSLYLYFQEDIIEWVKNTF